MSENKTILTTRRFELWWRKAQAWFATQFASINFKPVEDKIDEVKDAVDNIDFSAIAKQGSNHNASLTVVDNKIGTVPVGSDKDTIFAWLTTIYEYLAGQTPEDIPEGLGDRINLLLQFFGIAGTYEAEAVGQETTDNPVIDECKIRYAEVFGDLLPSGFVMPNSVTIDGTTYTGTVS